MENNIVVSICMITYGHEKFIEQAINGVLMQETNFEVELIIANDCSPDATDKVVQNILKNHSKSGLIKYIKHTKNMGMMTNFLFALKECKGKYIAICEGDDYWTNPNKLQKQVDFLEVNEDYVLCFHKINILKLNGSIVEDFLTHVPNEYQTKYNLASFGNYIHTPSVVFRNIIKEFPKEFEISPIGDFFLYMLLAEHGKIKYMEDTMCIYREGVGVWSGTDVYYRQLKTTYVFCLLASVFKEDKKICSIFYDRINVFLKDYKTQLTANDLEQLFVNDEVRIVVVNFLLDQNKDLNRFNVTNLSFKSLLKIMLIRIRKKLN